jgi:hypothetical protein
MESGWVRPSPFNLVRSVACDGVRATGFELRAGELNLFNFNSPFVLFTLGGISVVIAQLLIGLALLGQLDVAATEATLNFEETLAAVGGAVDQAFVGLRAGLPGL